jgi:hypothetical protein
MVVFRRLVGVVEDTPSLMRRVRRINRVHGSESIELKAGGRISFRTRTKLGARGHTCDALVLDEAHVLTTAAHGFLLPTCARGGALRCEQPTRATPRLGLPARAVLEVDVDDAANGAGPR